MAELLLEEKLPQALQALCEKLNKYVQEKQEEKNNAEEQAGKVSSQYWKPPIYYDDDDDDDESYIPLRDIISEPLLSVAIAPILPTKEPDDSLSIGDEHLSTIPETESDKVIKSSVEDLVLIPSKSEDLSDNKKSLLNRDTSIVYSPKIDSLLEEFAGELAHIDLIPPEINEADFDPEEDIRLVEQLLYDNSSPLDALKDHFEIFFNSNEDSRQSRGGEGFLNFSNPFFDSNDDCTSSDDESLSDEDVPKDEVKIYSNPLFEFDDEYISSDVNPLLDEVLENIKSKDSYVSNLDELALLVTPLSKLNEDECFRTQGGDLMRFELLLTMIHLL
ncbi:hypothetical protein Tco_0717387 [Tanacetum coccineum]